MKLVSVTLNQQFEICNMFFTTNKHNIVLKILLGVLDCH